MAVESKGDSVDTGVFAFGVASLFISSFEEDFVEDSFALEFCILVSVGSEFPIFCIEVCLPLSSSSELESESDVSVLDVESDEVPSFSFAWAEFRLDLEDISVSEFLIIVLSLEDGIKLPAIGFLVLIFFSAVLVKPWVSFDWCWICGAIFLPKGMALPVSLSESSDNIGP